MQLNVTGEKDIIQLREQFENGTWTIHVTQGVEHLNLLENSIEVSHSTKSR